jgi:hypothetical protein
MSSIIEGYEYDIFISYRQKDSSITMKHSGILKTQKKQLQNFKHHRYV